MSEALKSDIPYIKPPRLLGLMVMGRAAKAEAAWREPDKIIGELKNPYLLRWFLRPEGPSGGLYLHKICRDDDDRALHDHPWDSSILIIEGAYREVRADCPRGELFEPRSYRHMKAETAHRLVVVDGPVWTLVFTGPRRREWGFHCARGWVHWRDFVDGANTGQVGRGCDQPENKFRHEATA